MSLEHVQPQQHVHRLLLQDGEGAREELLLDLDLDHVHAPDDLLRADALGDACEALVNEALDAATLCGGLEEQRGILLDFASLPTEGTSTSASEVNSVLRLLVGKVSNSPKCSTHAAFSAAMFPKQTGKISKKHISKHSPHVDGAQCKYMY